MYYHKSELDDESQGSVSSPHKRMEWVTDISKNLLSVSLSEMESALFVIERAEFLTAGRRRGMVLALELTSHLRPGEVIQVLL
jgi:hypothetical protein